MFEKIAIANLMEIKVESYGNDQIEVFAPLDKNSNDKGTFFAGSIYSTMVLSGWALVTRILKDRGIDAEVVIATSTIDYLKPAKDDVLVSASPVNSTDIEKLLSSIDKKCRGKLEVKSILNSSGEVCAEFTGLYVAKLRK